MCVPLPSLFIQFNIRDDASHAGCLKALQADWLKKKRVVEKYRRKEKRAKLEEVAPARSGEVADLPKVHE